MTNSGLKEDALAVIGVSGRFPGARNVEDLWDLLSKGREPLITLSEDDLRSGGVTAEIFASPDYVRAAMEFGDTDWFDPSFFGLSQQQAASMDPQKRLFLECAWEALESAGCSLHEMGTGVGVFAGSGTSARLLEAFANPDSSGFLDLFQTLIDLEKDHLATQVSYRLNLEGPSLAVQTACSTSLVAVHMACQSLLNFECDVSIAGGVSLRPGNRGHLYEDGGLLSKDGHCRPFDADATGTIFASGVGVVALMRLADAIEQRYPIWATILGSAVNNDGSEKAGYTAPGFRGQARVIAAALAAAGVSPGDIGLVEAHGTGTVLGDAIELAALNEVYRSSPIRAPGCVIGSVKANVGHLDTASGVAGLVKAILCIKHRKFVPSVNFGRPNPGITEDGPFTIVTRLADWDGAAGRRVAAVSSFGIGGTNAHVIVGEAPELAPTPMAGGDLVLPLSARTATALQTKAGDLARHLRAASPNLADVAYTLQIGRDGFAHREAIVAGDTEEAVDALAALAATSLTAQARAATSARSLVFLLPGIMPLRSDVAGALYRTDAFFRQTVDQCADLFFSFGAADIRDHICGPTLAARPQDQPSRIDQCAQFALQYSLARLWMRWGAKPSAMLGYSLGEYVAACLSGVLTPEDAAKLVAVRARAMDEMPPGAMILVEAARQSVESFLPATMDVAAVNTAGQCVVAGSHGEVASLAASLDRAGIDRHILDLPRAYHSHSMEPAARAVAEAARDVKFGTLRIPYVSTLNGRWATEQEVCTPGYWGDHLRRTVQFAAAASELMRDPNRLLLEVGAGEYLGGLVRRPGDGSANCLRSLGRGLVNDRRDLRRVLGRIWTHGVNIDWRQSQADVQARRIGLPTYPFERRLCAPSQARAAGGAASRPRDAAIRDAAERPVPAPVMQPESHSLQPPSGSSDCESTIVAILATNLDQADIQLHDNFFHMGGDSLIALRIVSKIRTQLGVKVPLSILIDSEQTLKDLVKHVRDQVSRRADDRSPSEDKATPPTDPATSDARPAAGAEPAGQTPASQDGEAYLRAAAAYSQHRLALLPPPRADLATAIVGAGTMGRGIATCFLNAQMPVTVVGRSKAKLDAMATSIRGDYERLVLRGALEPQEIERRLALLHCTTDLVEVSEVDLVIETISENLGAKRQLFEQLDALAPPNAILATNTSYLDLEALADATSRPAQIVALHFSNPAHVMRLAEIARGKLTYDTTVSTVVSVARRLGKEAVVVKAHPGFVANRLLRIQLLEADRLLLEGALPHEIDAAMTDFGYPLGPLALADMVGLDIAWRSRQAAGGRSEIADALCEIGRFGRKTGRGYYRYEAPDTPSPDPEVEALIKMRRERASRTGKDVSNDEIVERLLLPMINEGFQIFDDGLVEAPSDIDLICSHGFAFPIWHGGPLRYADTLGLEHIVARLTEFARQSGRPQLLPADLLVRAAEDGRRLTDIPDERSLQLAVNAR